VARLRAAGDGPPPLHTPSAAAVHSIDPRSAGARQTSARLAAPRGYCPVCSCRRISRGALYNHIGRLECVVMEHELKAVDGLPLAPESVRLLEYLGRRAMEMNTRAMHARSPPRPRIWES
jgi:hypothetical protein